MEGKIRSWPRFSKTWLGSLALVVAIAACGQVAPSDDGVASVGEDIRGGTLMGTGGIGFAVKVDQTMSDGKRLLCSGAFITPHVVLTAAHCTRNYDYGSVITPTTDTVIRYGTSFADSQKIAGDEKVGWRELGSTDIGLYRVANAVTLPTIPKLYRSCDTINLVGQRIVVYGRMVDGNQAKAADYYMSPQRTVRGVVNGIGANGNYLQIDSTTDAGDSGGPWVYGEDRIVAATHSSTTGSDYGSRFCDVAEEVETQVQAWGEAIAFVEDSAESGADSGGRGAGQAGARDGGGPATSDGAAGRSDVVSTTDSGTAGAHTGMGGDGSGAAGHSAPRGSGGVTASAGAGAAGSLGDSNSGRAGSGATGHGAGGSDTSAEVTRSAGRSGEGTAGRPATDSNGQSGAQAGTRAFAGMEGPKDGNSAREEANAPEKQSAGCGCMTPGADRGERSFGGALLIAALAAARSRRSARHPTDPRGGGRSAGHAHSA